MVCCNVHIWVEFEHTFLRHLHTKKQSVSRSPQISSMHIHATVNTNIDVTCAFTYKCGQDPHWYSDSDTSQWSLSIIFKHSTLIWLTCNKQFWCFILKMDILEADVWLWSWLITSEMLYFKQSIQHKTIILSFAVSAKPENTSLCFTHVRLSHKMHYVHRTSTTWYSPCNKRNIC